MQIIDVVHQFFYQENEQFNKHYMSVSFNGDIFYSYYTAIARKIKGKQGQDVLLISDNNFSKTTAKHINYLLQANPHFRVIYVPQEYGSHCFNLDTIIERIKKYIEFTATSKMSLKANREDFSKYYNMLIRLDEYVCDIDKNLIEKYTPLYNTINDPVKLKELRKYFNPKNELAFIWFDTDYVRTSKRCNSKQKRS